MKRIIITALASVMLAGCFNYVTPKESNIEVTEAHTTAFNAVQATHSDFKTIDDKIHVEETETALETILTPETETKTEREVVTVYVTQGVNIRAQETKLSDRLGGADFGESFEAYADTLANEFIEIRYGDGTAFVYGGCLTADYDVIAQIKAEQERINEEARKQQETEAHTTAFNAVQATESDDQTEADIFTTETEETLKTENTAVYSAEYFKLHGVLTWGGSKWTYYSQRILSGEGLNIPNRHLDENGYVCDGDGYIVCAADLSYIPRYTVIDTPLGKQGKIYDTGCAYGVIDVYTDW